MAKILKSFNMLINLLSKAVIVKLFLLSRWLYSMQTFSPCKDSVWKWTGKSLWILQIIYPWSGHESIKLFFQHQWSINGSRTSPLGKKAVNLNRIITGECHSNWSPLAGFLGKSCCFQRCCSTVQYLQSKQQEVQKVFWCAQSKKGGVEVAQKEAFSFWVLRRISI